MNATNTQIVTLGEIGTAHVWFASVGQPAGCDLQSAEGEPLCLPGDSVGGDYSDWWNLKGDFDGKRWLWLGDNGNPKDFRGNTVTKIVAFV